MREGVVPWVLRQILNWRFKIQFVWIRGHVSTVVTVAALLSGLFGVRFQAQATDFPLLRKVPTDSGVHLASYSVGAGFFFSPSKAKRSRCELYTHLHLVKRSRVRGVIPLYSPIRLHGVNREKVTSVYSVVAWILFEYIIMMMIIIISWLRYCYNNASVAHEINPSYEDFKSNR